MKNNHIGWRSLCCGAKVIVQGGITLYNVCTKCHQACDTYGKPRRTWERNPQTQITPNKKKISKTRLTKKEIDKIRQNEDF